MSYAVRDWIRTRTVPPAPPTSEAHGPHPSLVDVLERHPDWRERLEKLMRAPVDRTFLQAVGTKVSYKRKRGNLRKGG